MPASSKSGGATAPPRGRRGGDRRGSSADRRARRAYLLRTFGDGATCLCVHCFAPLHDGTVECDRIDPTGGYGRTNVLPACRTCNASRGNAPLAAEVVVAAARIRAAAAAARQER